MDRWGVNRNFGSRYFAALSLYFLLGCLSFLFGAPELIVVDSTKVLRTFPQPPIGINVNHLMDADSKRPPGTRPLTKALTDLGVKSLRFPEGELGDSYLWATPPFPAQSATKPQWALRGPKLWPSQQSRFSTPDFQPLPDIMGFDAFMELCQATQAAPIIIVAYDSAYKKVEEGSVKPTLEELKISAVEWVRYANITKKWNIRYWEIGNETDIKPEAHSGADPGAKQYVQDVIAFSRAMKAVDPTIKIGINVWNNKRLTELLTHQELGAAIDYLSLHNYPTFGWKEGYEVFRKKRVDFMHGLREANTLLDASAFSEKDKARLEILVTETNTIDWSKDNGWPNVADLGHALVNFEIIGQTLLVPRVTSLQQWVTRWIHNDETDRPLRVYDALDQNNNLTPLGHSVAMWANHLGDNLVSATGTDSVIAYASTSSTQSRLAVFLLNKTRETKSVALTFKNRSPGYPMMIHTMKGENPEALVVTSQSRELLSGSKTIPELSLDPLSITVIVFAASR